MKGALQMNDIVKKAKNGEIQALEQLIHMYEIKLYKTARTILDCEDDINEAVQQTIILVYKNINQLKNEKCFGAWMFKILVNKCKDIWNRNNNRDKRMVDLDENQDIPSIEKEDYSFVNDALNQLNEEYKEVTILYYYDGFSVKEISKILNLPQGTVKSRLSRARKKLEKIIKKEEV